MGIPPLGGLISEFAATTSRMVLYGLLLRCVIVRASGVLYLSLFSSGVSGGTGLYLHLNPLDKGRRVYSIFGFWNWVCPTVGQAFWLIHLSLKRHIVNQGKILHQGEYGIMEKDKEV